MNNKKPPMDQVIRFRCPPNLAALLTEAARSEERPVSEWIREAIREKLINTPPRPEAMQAYGKVQRLHRKALDRLGEN